MSCILHQLAMKSSLNSVEKQQISSSIRNRIHFLFAPTIALRYTRRIEFREQCCENAKCEFDIYLTVHH